MAMFRKEDNDDIKKAIISDVVQKMRWKEWVLKISLKLLLNGEWGGGGGGVGRIEDYTQKKAFKWFY